MQGEWRKSSCRIVERRPCVERIVAQSVKRAAVVLVGAGLGDDVDLRAAGGAALSGINACANPKLRDCIESDIEPGIGLLRLLLDAACVYARQK